MTYSLEAAFHIPLSLILTAALVLQFPLEYGKCRRFAVSVLRQSAPSSLIYEAGSDHYAAVVNTRPEKLTELILWGADLGTDLNDILREKGGPGS